MNNQNNDKDLLNVLNEFLDNEERYFMGFIERNLEDYYSNDDVARLDDCWKTLLDEWEDNDPDDSEVRHLSRKECADEILRLEKKLARETLKSIEYKSSCALKKLEQVLTNNVK